MSDGDLDVFDRAVGQEDHLVLPGIERDASVARRYPFDIEVAAVSGRDDDPHGKRLAFRAESLDAERELPHEELAVEHDAIDDRPAGTEGVGRRPPDQRVTEAADVFLERLPVSGSPRSLPHVWRPARLMNTSDASTPVELGEERSPQLDELVLWVIQHRKKRLAVLGRECNEVAVECDGIQQDTSSAIGAVPDQLRREFERLLTGDTRAGNYRHGRRILRERAPPSGRGQPPVYDREHGPDDDFVVLVDPDGNRFCVVAD